MLPLILSNFFHLLNKSKYLLSLSQSQCRENKRSVSCWALNNHREKYLSKWDTRLHHGDIIFHHKIWLRNISSFYEEIFIHLELRVVRLLCFIQFNIYIRGLRLWLKQKLYRKMQAIGDFAEIKFSYKKYYNNLQWKIIRILRCDFPGDKKRILFNPCHIQSIRMC